MKREREGEVRERERGLIGEKGSSDGEEDGRNERRRERGRADGGPRCGRPSPKSLGAKQVAEPDTWAAGDPAAGCRGMGQEAQTTGGHARARTYTHAHTRVGEPRAEAHRGRGPLLRSWERPSTASVIDRMARNVSVGGKAYTHGASGSVHEVLQVLRRPHVHPDLRARGGRAGKVHRVRFKGKPFPC